MVIKASMVDSFQLRSPGIHPRCLYKGCTRQGRVRLFFSPVKGKQESAWICVNHAFDLANNVLMEYKFKREI